MRLLGSLLLLLLLVLQHSLDDLLLLNQERSDNSLLHAVGASGATVRSLHGLVGLGHLSVLSRSQRGNTGQSNATVTALDLGSLFLDVLGHQLSTWGLDDLDLVGSGVVWMLVWRTKNGQEEMAEIKAKLNQKWSESCEMRWKVIWKSEHNI